MDEMHIVRVPQETVNDDVVLLVEWHVEDGSVVEEGQHLADLETSKAAVEITSPGAGRIHQHVSAETEVPVGGVLCVVGGSPEEIDRFLAEVQIADSVQSNDVSTSDPNSRSSATLTPTAAVGTAIRDTDRRAVETVPPRSVRFSRRALKVLTERGMSVADFENAGLVRERDVLDRIDARPLMPQVVDLGVPYRTERLSRLKKQETKILSWGQRQALTSSVTIQVRTQGRDRLERQDPDSVETRASVIIQECARLLRRFPQFNACCIDEEVRSYEQINVGYALDAGRGLKVPVIRDADQRSLDEIRASYRTLIAAYLDNSLSPEMLAGGTFTITDLSGSGVLSFAPLISEGQSAILGVGAESPTADGDFVYQLVLSFDHRVTEGRAAASFMAELKQQLQGREDRLFPETKQTGAASFDGRSTACSRCGITASEATSRRHFLVRVATDADDRDALVCTVCLTGR